LGTVTWASENNEDIESKDTDSLQERKERKEERG
jgi:hypothetical protein